MRILFAFHYDLLIFTNRRCDGSGPNGVQENGPTRTNESESHYGMVNTVISSW